MPPFKIPAALNQKSVIVDVLWNSYQTDANDAIIKFRKKGWRVISCTQITDEGTDKEGKKYSQLLFVVEEESCAHEALQMIKEVVASTSDPFLTDTEKYVKIVEILNAAGMPQPK